MAYHRIITVAAVAIWVVVGVAVAALLAGDLDAINAVIGAGIWAVATTVIAIIETRSARGR